MAKPTRLQVVVQEATADGEESRMSFNIGSSIDTLSSIEIAAKSVIEALQAIVTGTVVAVSFSKPIDISGWTLAPSDGVDTDKLVGARLIMASADPFYAQLNFPTFDLAKLEAAGSKNVDQTDADVIALLAALQGTTLTTNQDQEVDTVDQFYRTYGSKK